MCKIFDQYHVCVHQGQTTEYLILIKPLSFSLAFIQMINHHFGIACTLHSMKEKLKNYPTLFLTLQKFVKKTGCLPLWATKDFKERTVKQTIIYPRKAIG